MTYSIVRVVLWILSHQKAAWWLTSESKARRSLRVLMDMAMRLWGQGMISWKSTQRKQKQKLTNRTPERTSKREIRLCPSLRSSYRSLMCLRTCQKIRPSLPLAAHFKLTNTQDKRLVRWVRFLRDTYINTYLNPRIKNVKNHILHLISPQIHYIWGLRRHRLKFITRLIYHMPLCG